MSKPQLAARVTDSARADHKVTARTGASFASIVVHLTAVLAFVAFVFPPLNWPDERRNLHLLESGDYGVFYQAVQKAVAWMFEGFTHSESLGEFSDSSAQNPMWRRIDGGLRYLIMPGDGPASYYMAKIASILLVLVASLLLARRLGLTDRNSARLYLCCLLAPAVAYQLVQISTDALFIVMSVFFYFVRTPRGKCAFAILAAALVVEDRSFGILACIALTTVALQIVLPWERIRDSWLARLFILLACCATAAILGTILARTLLTGNTAIASYFAFAPGFGDVNDALAYTWGKSFNLAQSPGILYAGLVYLPSASEFFLTTSPLYVAVAPLFLYMAVIAVREPSERGMRFFYVLVGTLTVFFLTTSSTHVFEHGRYYLSIIPLLVVAALGAMTKTSDAFPAPNRSIVTLLAGLNIVLTCVIAVPVLF